MKKNGNYFLNREKYMVIVCTIYLGLALSNLHYRFWPGGIEGLLFIVMLGLPFLNQRLSKVVFKI